MKHNIIILSGIISIAFFTIASVYVDMYKEWEFNHKVLFNLASALIVLFIVDAVISEYKKHNDKLS